MSVGIELVVGARGKRSLSRAAFRELLVDLIRERIVTRPVALVRGAGYEDGAVGYYDLLDAVRSGKRAVAHEVLYQGGSSAQLLAALHTSAQAKLDLCAQFAGFDLAGNLALAEAFTDEGWLNGPVLIYSLAKPRKVRAVDAMDGHESSHRLQTFLRFVSDSGPEQTPAPLAKVLRKHLGKLRELVGTY